METIQKDTTDFVLIEAFLQHLLTLDSVQLTTFYCEICHERLSTPQENLPTNPFYERGGSCSNCDRYDEVSNPYINQFLNVRGVVLKATPALFFVGGPLGDETSDLIRKWLIPYDYAYECSRDKNYNEEASFSWVRYGRKKQKDIYKCTSTSPDSKALLLPFFPRCYSLDRFTTGGAIQSNQDANQTPEPLLPNKGSTAIDSSPPELSTFERLWSFVDRKLINWKGK